ncbi:TBC1 domain family member 24-like [Lepisosteus oculatus]|uniref:TBC1 domain family member 24-like n=1 Tax=Lepisosteus oculatus TaxID=7918 RepID=UPI0037217BB1
MERPVPQINISKTDEELPAPSSSARSRSHSCQDRESRPAGLPPEDEPTEPGARRPRSRSFYSFETSKSTSDGPLTRSNAMRPRSKSLLSGDGMLSWLQFRRPRTNSSGKKPPSKDLDGSGKNVLNIPILTISESDNWEVSSSSTMKYWQFVDWEKMEPKSALNYQKILQSDCKQLKSMARAGFWSTSHTLRAKAYHHIIHGISCRSVTPDREIYQQLSEKLFGKKKTSTHPFPEYMENGAIPMYCLSKTGVNSVRKILLCIAAHFPDITHCPVLPALVSLLLHFSEDEAECFHSVCRLIAYNDPDKRYIDQTFLAHRASCMTFRDLANKYCHGAHKLIATSNQSLFDIYSDWIMWIFGAGLPFEYAIRVLDVFLLEGYKVLYRVALVLLSLYKGSVPSTPSHIADIRQDIMSFVGNISCHITVDKLLEKAFSIRLFSRKEINLLLSANMSALLQKGISIHQKRMSVHLAVDLDNFSSSIVTGQEMRMVWSWIPERFALFQPIMLFTTSEHGRSLTSFYSQVEGSEPTVLLLKTEDEEVCGAFLSSDWSERNKGGGKGLSFFGTGECFVFTLCPEMERYEWAILHQPKIAKETHIHSSPHLKPPPALATEVPPPVTLAGPGGTPQDPSYLTVPFSVPSEGPPPEPAPRKPPKHPFPASMFMAGGTERIIIGGGGGQALCIAADLLNGWTEHCDTFQNPPLCRDSFRIQCLEAWGIQNSL